MCQGKTFEVNLQEMFISWIILFYLELLFMIEGFAKLPNTTSVPESKMF